MSDMMREMLGKRIGELESERDKLLRLRSDDHCAMLKLEEQRDRFKAELGLMTNNRDHWINLCNMAEAEVKTPKHEVEINDKAHQNVIDDLEKAEFRLSQVRKYLDWLKVLDNDPFSPDHASIHNIVTEFEEALK